MLLFIWRSSLVASRVVRVFKSLGFLLIAYACQCVLNSCHEDISDIFVS